MEIEISVRGLVEFVMREGDLDNRRTGGREDALQEGARMHRVLQKRMGEEYEAEVPLAFEVNYEDYVVRISGRADGIIRREEQIVVDEIKTTHRDMRYVTEPSAVHLAQAKCYAFFLTELEHLDVIGVRMTYCNIDTEEIKYFHENYTAKELRNWFEELMAEYQKWTDFEFDWKKKRKESLKSLEFPFAYREGQKELVGHVYQTICHKKKLYIQAPTGVGKTVSTVFPALRAIGEDKADKLFYFTAKTITRTVASDCIDLLRKKGLACKSVVLTAKEKICFMEALDCNPSGCPYAEGHFDRINDAIYDLLTNEDDFTREKIESYARKHKVCPFEMSLDMSLFADAVIGDYNYLFDPYVHLKRFFVQGIKGAYLFLVDEAHNLVDRGRQMFSASIVKENFLKLKTIVKPYNTGLEKYLDKVNRIMLSMKKEMVGEQQVITQTGDLAMQLSRLHSAISGYLEDHENVPVRQDILDVYFEVGRFLDVYELLDENYVTYGQFMEDASYRVKEFCMDPSERLKECMDQGVASILFSATFLPIQYYKQLLGGRPEDFEVYARTAFSREQLKLLVAREVTSKYTRRNEMEYYQIAAYIHEIVRQKCGNYMIFSPSHQFQEKIYETYMEYFYDEDAEECICQRDFMKEEERESFLNRFRVVSAEEETTINVFPKNYAVNDKEIIDAELANVETENTVSGWDLIQMDIEQESRSIIGFCVLGGIFSEGIDLKGESLIGAIIIGTGLPQINFESELLKKHFDAEGKDGFDYAYRYPGMNKVLQAAGRVIRTVSDRGVVALLDERFLQNSYRNLFPREWESFEITTIQQVGAQVEQFWKS